LTERELFSRRGPVPDDWFEREEGVPMSKEPSRALTAALLAPLSGASALEIGAGTGGMTVELLRAVGPEGSVVSLEVSETAAALARTNVARAGLSARSSVILGRAPEDIPEELFDVIFIGGHGRGLESVADACWQRLARGGRILITAVTPGTTARALVRLEELGADAGFWRVASAAGRKAGGDWLLSAHNPIDLIWGDKR